MLDEGGTKMSVILPPNPTQNSPNFLWPKTHNGTKSLSREIKNYNVSKATVRKKYKIGYAIAQQNSPPKSSKQIFIN